MVNARKNPDKVTSTYFAETTGAVGYLAEAGSITLTSRIPVTGLNRETWPIWIGRSRLDCTAFEITVREYELKRAYETNNAGMPARIASAQMTFRETRQIEFPTGTANSGTE